MDGSIRYGEPVERKVQLTGGSSFTVAIPKNWAESRGIGSGSSVHLYPFEDRLVIVEPGRGGASTSATIDADTVDRETLNGHIRAAYARGSDEIAITADVAISSSQRRAASQAITDLVGIEIIREDERELRAKMLLDPSELSLDEAVEQLARIALSMHENAVETLVSTDGDGASAEHVVSRKDANRLFALVSRQFYCRLGGVPPADAREFDGRTAFARFRTARQLDCVAMYAERIARVAGRQHSPPRDALAEDFETVATDAQAVVRAALDGDVRGALVRREAILERLDELDSELYRDPPEGGYLYGRVIESLRRTTECGGEIAEIVALTEIIGA